MNEKIAVQIPKNHRKSPQKGKIIIPLELDPERGIYQLAPSTAPKEEPIDIADKILEEEARHRAEDKPLVSEIGHGLLWVLIKIGQGFGYIVYFVLLGFGHLIVGIAGLVYKGMSQNSRHQFPSDQDFSKSKRTTKTTYNINIQNNISIKS